MKTKWQIIKISKTMARLSYVLNLILIVLFLSLQREISRNNDMAKLLEFIESNTFHPLILTAYNSHINQTDHTPRITASGRKTSYQTIALSRDFIQRYNYPDCKGLNYGDTVTIIMRKQFIVEDTMNQRYTNRGDIWTESKKEALRFGKNKGLLVINKKKNK